ncbi:hypothetical protein B0H13DRAFT_1900600 [Mycena leptocephala]|nr:hypothetical protein B0H13DRAFT_1900600 [Mycena leptocephala]
MLQALNYLYGNFNNMASPNPRAGAAVPQRIPTSPGLRISPSLCLVEAAPKAPHSAHTLLAGTANLPFSLPSGGGRSMKWGLRGRLKVPRQSNPSPRSLNTESPDPSFTTLTFDAILTSLNVLRESADALPPLKSAVGGVVAVWDLAERLAASDEDAQKLAWRAITILDTIYNAVGEADPQAISPRILKSILDFERLLNDLRNAMDRIAKRGCIRRLLHLHRIESQLASFNSRLDLVAEAFAIGALTHVELAVVKMDVAMQKFSVDATCRSLSYSIKEPSSHKPFFGIVHLGIEPERLEDFQRLFSHTQKPSDISRMRGMLQVNGISRITFPGPEPTHDELIFSVWRTWKEEQARPHAQRTPAASWGVLLIDLADMGYTCLSTTPIPVEAFHLARRRQAFKVFSAYQGITPEALNVRSCLRPMAILNSLAQ